MRAVHLRQRLSDPEVRPIRSVKENLWRNYLPGGKWAIVSTETELWILRITEIDFYERHEPLFAAVRVEERIVYEDFASLGNGEVALGLFIEAE